MKRNKRLPAVIRFGVVATAALLVTAAGPTLYGQPPPPDVCIQFEIELVSLNLTGGPFPMPLASDPGNLLGDSVDGYGFVKSQVDITLSSQRDTSPGPASNGKACAVPFQGTGERPSCFAKQGCPEIEPLDPADLEPGQQFFVDSFFDVFFDITVTDVDDRSGRDFAGQSDGSSFTLPDNGPASLQSFYPKPIDPDAPNFGLIPPPQVRPYIGHFLIKIPLGGDINGNGEDDVIKFTIASHSVGDENRQFIILPDGTILDEFDSAAFLDGAIMDAMDDPPFQIGDGSPASPDPDAFGGPTTAASFVSNLLPDNDGDGLPDYLDPCPNSDAGPTIVIQGCDSGVANVALSLGCRISDSIAAIAAGARNHGAYVSGVARLLDSLEAQGFISHVDKGRIQRCAARSSVGKK